MLAMWGPKPNERKTIAYYETVQDRFGSTFHCFRKPQPIGSIVTASRLCPVEKNGFMEDGSQPLNCRVLRVAEFAEIVGIHNRFKPRKGMRKPPLAVGHWYEILAD